MRSWELVDPGYGEDPLPGLQMVVLSLYSHQAERERKKKARSFLVKKLAPFRKPPPS